MQAGPGGLKGNMIDGPTLTSLLALFDKHCRDDDWREVLRLICSQIDEQFVGNIATHLIQMANVDEWDGQKLLPEWPLATECLVLKQATSSPRFEVKNRAAANRNERVVGVTLS